MSPLPRLHFRDEPEHTGPSRELFAYEARRDGRAVVVIRGIHMQDGVVVETEVFPVTATPGADGIHRPFSFSTPDQARRFADEALTALEYLNCSVI